MRFTPTPLAGVFVVDLEPRVDARGFFARVWCSQESAAHGLSDVTQQANLSWNHRRGTLRGMHFQWPPHAESKLVRTIRGAIQDVALDLRAGSPTFGQWFACELTAENRRGLVIPEGCAHGYLTLTDDCEVFYLVSASYQESASGGVRWDCPALQGAWPFLPEVVSEKDQQLPHELPEVVF